MDIRRIGIGLLLLLILANVWKWWPTVGARLYNLEVSKNRTFTVEDFQVHGLTATIPSGMERDLFNKGASRRIENEGSLGGQRTAMASARQHAPAPAVPILVQGSTAHVGLKQIEQVKCIGVLFQQDKQPEAYLVHGEQHYIVRPGDVLEGRFEVEKIMIDAVYFKDRQTGLTGSVPVDGKEGG